MSRKATKYRIHCETDGDVEQTVWNDDAFVPTCPYNNTHTIDPLVDPVIIEQVKDSQTYILDPTPGFYMTTTIPLAINADTPGTVQVKPISYNFDMSLWLSKFVPTADMITDELSIIVAPNSPAGVITVTGQIGDTVLNVLPAAMQSGFIVKGHYLKIATPDMLTIQDLGMITNYNMTTNTVTVENALTSVFPPGSILLLNIYIMKDYVFSAPGVERVFGGKSVNTKKIPAGKVIQFLYKNTTGTAKTVYFDIEFNHN